MLKKRQRAPNNGWGHELHPQLWTVDSGQLTVIGFALDYRHLSLRPNAYFGSIIMAKSEEEIKKALSLGTEAYRANEYEKAIKYLSEFVKERPSFADVYNMLGLSYHYLSRLEEAIDSFQKGLDLNPRYSEIALNLAVTLFDVGRYDQAAALQDRLAKEVEKRPDGLDPYALKKLANMHAEIGDAYHVLGLYDQAIEEYIKSLHLAPQFPDVRTRLAESYRDKGQIDEAIRELEQLKEAQPLYLRARIALGVSYYTKCKIAEAIREWKEVVQIDPANKAAKAYLKLVPPDAKCP